MSEVFMLPENLYGLVVAEPLQLDRQTDGLFVYVTELGRGYGLMIANFCIQLMFVIEVRDINNAREGDECNMELASLHYVCVFVFCVSLFAEIRDTASFISALLRIRVATTGYERVGADHGAVLEADTSGVHGLLRAFAKRGHDDSAEGWSLDGMTRVSQVLNLIFILAPKMLIAILLGWVGSSYIVRSEDAETMILNTLAVLFVIDIDEYFYGTFTSTSMKRQLQCCRPLVFDEVSNKARLLYWIESVFVFPALVVGATWGMVYRDHCLCT